ncbi:hypothetical protein H5410_040952 [Solanum commersonii]|uniref:Uncharacterized protein n=1 Tax=Solanum commersonii TaxID=4109 RepID=A0A9J5XU26_SOLCO|nr:hypothetical protein H5410_040952 [Solanum commersonii]
MTNKENLMKSTTRKRMNIYITYLASEGKKNNSMSSALASDVLKYSCHKSFFENISKNTLACSVGEVSNNSVKLILFIPYVKTSSSRNVQEKRHCHSQDHQQVVHHDYVLPDLFQVTQKNYGQAEIVERWNSFKQIFEADINQKTSIRFKWLKPPRNFSKINNDGSCIQGSCGG